MMNISKRIATVGVTLALGAAIAAAAMAGVPNSFDRHYYSDASLTTDVGMETQYCDGHRYIWYGYRTAYWVDENIEGCGAGGGLG